MADVQVTCITKPHPQSPHEHITHVGNPSAGWNWPREQVVASIEAKTNTFFVRDPKVGKARGHRRCAGGWARSVSTHLCRRLLER